jgi:hypothetical protein
MNQLDMDQDHFILPGATEEALKALPPFVRGKLVLRELNRQYATLK